jgi:hypothetical protein
MPSKKKCKFGLNKRTKKCLKHPRKKAAGTRKKAAAPKKRRSAGTMDWLTKGRKPARVTRRGGMTIREYSPEDSMKAIYGEW